VPELAGIGAIAWSAPVAFLIGVGVGLGLASRFRIVKRPEDDDDRQT
jgi:hypothetical protein